MRGATRLRAVTGSSEVAVRHMCSVHRTFRTYTHTYNPNSPLQRLVTLSSRLQNTVSRPVSHLAAARRDLLCRCGATAAMLRTASATTTGSEGSSSACG